MVFSARAFRKLSALPVVVRTLQPSRRHGSEMVLYNNDHHNQHNNNTHNYLHHVHFHYFFSHNNDKRLCLGLL